MSVPRFHVALFAVRTLFGFSATFCDQAYRPNTGRVTQ